MRIGIYGGTFNPIHHGHIQSAIYIKHKLNLDKIIFIPNKTSNYKIINQVLDSKHRLAMIKIAIENYDFLDVSSLEIDRDCDTYTIDTIKKLKKMYSKDELFYIYGSDVYQKIKGWKEGNFILSTCDFIVINRLIEIEKNQISNAIFLNVPYIPISSTELRKKIKINGSISLFVPKNVKKYIDKHKLYMNS